MLFSVSMFPVGAGDSLVKPVAEVVDEIDRAGLHYELTGMDTVVEGDWDTVLPVIKRAEERLRRNNDRVFLQLTVDDHAGAENRLHQAVGDVERELGRSIRHGFA